MQIVERALGILTVVAGGAWVFYVLGWGSDADLDAPVLLVLVWGGMGVLVLWSLGFTVHVLATRGTPERRRLRRLAVLPAALLFCFLSVWTGLAFQVRFFASQPALDRMVRQGGELSPGTRVGFFWVREAEIMPNGVVRIITTRCFLDDCGLVYSPNGEPPRVGEDSYRQIRGGWWRWWRSW